MGARLGLPARLVAVALTQEGLVSAGQCDAAGVLRGHRASLVRSGRLTHLQRGVYDLAPSLRPGMPAGPDEGRRRTAWWALLAAGPDAIAVGACALALLRVDGLPLELRPEAAMPGGSHRRPRGEVIVRSFDHGMEVVRVGGARVAAPAWALAQAVCELDRAHAVAVLDAALRRRLLPRGVSEVDVLVRGRRGAARARPWLSLADGRAQSPLETWARLECVDAGVPPHELQVAVRDRRGRVVARGDLGWWRSDGRLLVVEMDGVVAHGGPAAVYTDRVRQNAVVSADVDVLRFTARDLRTGGVVSAAVRAHLSAPQTVPVAVDRHRLHEVVEPAVAQRPAHGVLRSGPFVRGT